MSRSIRLAAWISLLALMVSLAAPALAVSPERADDRGQESWLPSWGSFWNWVLTTVLPDDEVVPPESEEVVVGGGDPLDPMNNSESGDEGDRGPGLDPTGGD